MSNEKAIEYLKELKKSAEDRKTEQGIQLYTKWISELEKSASDAAVKQVYLDMQRDLRGIENWGFFTEEESGYA